MADPGERPGGPGPPPSFLDQNEARKAEQKKFFLRPLPPRLSQGLDYRLPLIRRSVSAIIVPRFTVLKVELDKAVIYLFIYLLIVLCLFIILGLQAVSKKRGRQREQNSFAGAHFLVLCVSLDGV